MFTNSFAVLTTVFTVCLQIIFAVDVGMHVIADNHSLAVGIGNITQSGDQTEISLLKEKIKHLEELLAEKERLIKVYEKMMKERK